jgi:hypothetical protein
MIEVEHDIENYQGRGLCYPPKPKAIIVLLYIIQKQEAKNNTSGIDKRLMQK